MGISRIG